MLLLLLLLQDNFYPDAFFGNFAADIDVVLLFPLTN